MSREDTLALVFAAGLSTSARQTDISGRGVGMDVVMRNVTQAGGRVQVESQPEQGTRLTMRIPLASTLLVIRALAVQAGGDTYFVPASFVQSIRLPAPAQARRLPDGRQVVNVDGSVCCLSSATSLLGGVRQDDRAGNARWLVIRNGRRAACIEVDRVLGIEEIVITDLGALFEHVPCFSGAALSGDGEVTLVVHAPWLVEAADAAQASVPHSPSIRERRDAPSANHCLVH